MDKVAKLASLVALVAAPLLADFNYQETQYDYRRRLV